MHSFISIMLTLFFFLGGLDAWKYNLQEDVINTIIVDQSGQGNFKSVQKAIDSIPSDSSAWTRIHINSGVYVEKVTIQKPNIVLEGDSDQFPVIAFGDGGDVVTSPTFKLEADNFVARNIIFANTYNHPLKLEANGKTNNNISWAPAATIAGDKASFYHSSFLSLQDTLSDAKGRHYFYNCTIEGAIDFIWGNGQSIYEKCLINSITDKVGHGGYITANGREGANETTGFVFKDCHVSGTGPINLGRPYRNFSRVLFAGTYMDNIITREGWDASRSTGHEDLLTYSEANCSGPGANMAHRVSWLKKLSNEEVARFTNTASFINQDGWLEKQPK